MEGRATNFDQVLAHFRASLEGAMYVAVDMELTGCDLPGEPDTYLESAGERLSKLCRIARRHVPIQLGLTLVHAEGEQFKCTSYNFYAFPSDGPEGDGSFMCRPSALRFNAGHNIDFNAWIYQGVPYMTREDEARYLATARNSIDDEHERNVGLLRLWQALCDARVPLIVHSPLDLFFLLTSFERRRLPSNDPGQMAALIKQCFPCVFDVAYLHGLVGGFQNLSLTKFLDEAKRRYEQLAWEGHVPKISFKLSEETAARYWSGTAHAHEAGYDSLATAQLYAYLIALAPEKVKVGVNHLFLYKSVECLDLDSAGADGVVGRSILDPSREVMRVARVPAASIASAVQRLTSLKWEFRRLDSSHLLVMIPWSCDHDAKKDIVDASLQLGNEIQWLSFEQWLAGAKQRAYSDGASGDGAAKAAPHAAVAHAAPPTAAKAAPHAAAAPPPAKAEARAPPSKALQWLDNCCSEPRFTGAIKSFNPAMGFGFIDCADTFARYGRDVFLHHSQMGDCVLGQQVSFEVALNSRGQPQAKVINALDVDDGVCARWLLGELGQLKSKVDVQDGEEALTTEVCSVGNLSEVESSRSSGNGSCVSDSDPVSMTPASLHG